MILTAAMLTFVLVGCGSTTSTGGEQNGEQAGNVQGEESGGNASVDINQMENSIDAPEFSVESGFYDEDFELEISYANSDMKIYYTTDGSIPDSDDILYEGPITLTNPSSNKNVLAAVKDIKPENDYIPGNINKCNVIRAIAISDDGEKTEVRNGTFFVGLDREKLYGDVPVISLCTDYDNLFGYEQGIYVLGKTYDDWLDEDPSNKWEESWKSKGNYSNKGKEWEREVAVEFITADEEPGFNINMGMRIMGAASRSATQKSFRLTCRKDEYGTKNIKYDLIKNNERTDGNGEVSKYRSFVLRNGGNDCDYCKLRDPLLQGLVKDLDFETLQSEPVVVYLDGEYWGMYSMMEDYSDHYIENNYGSGEEGDPFENDNIIIIKRAEISDGEDSDIELFNEMFDYITNTDLSDAANYEKACEYIDVESFAQYFAFNLYINNKDSIFDGNNWSMWRVRETSDNAPEADGRWRMMVYDTEYSSGLYGDGGTSTNNISKALKSTKEGGLLLNSLIANESFKEMFIVELLNMRNSNFEATRAKNALDYWDGLYAPLYKDTIDRFGPGWIVWWNDPMDHYDDEVDAVRKFLNGRYNKFVEVVAKNFDVSDPVSISLSTDEEGSGAISINNNAVSFDYATTAQYFTDFEISLTAIPAEGKEFDHWEISGVEDIDTNSAEISFTVSGDVIAVAVFK